MIRFEVLGEVAARQEAWRARLSTQQQHLLAALVLSAGAPVTRERLEGILWDLRAPYPEKGVARVAHEVRAILQEAAPGSDLVPSSHGGYRLQMASEQADILRFRATAHEARRTGGPDGARLMRQALEEWGRHAVGLRGGNPLAGLPGQWADSTRHLLKTQYRDAVIHCLAYDASCHEYGSVLAECEQFAADCAPALLDEEFVRLWILAAANTLDTARAYTIYGRAHDAAARSGGQLGPTLRGLGSKLRDGRTPLASSAATPEPGPVIDDPKPSAGETGSGQTQTNTASGSGTVFGVQGGNIYYYQAADPSMTSDRM